MSVLLDFGDPTINEGCLSGHYWHGGLCSRCGEQLRCACGRFVTIEGLDKHLADECPIKYEDYEGDEDA